MSKEIEISPRQIAKAIQDLLDKNELLQDKVYELEERIDKAIEYIDNAQTLNYGTIKEFNIKEFPFVQHILEILKGED